MVSHSSLYVIYVALSHVLEYLDGGDSNGTGADWIDGPFNYEYDIHNALNGGKGTFFLNVRTRHHVPFVRSPGG